MNDSSLDVVLVRHGETAWSRTGQHTGRTNVPLTELGRRQADELATMLGNRDFALVLSSPLSRALDTGNRAGLLATPELSDDLLEWDYGVYEGITTAETRLEIPGWSVWTHPILDGESIEEVGLRADAVIGRIKGADGATVLFAHGHYLRILTARWLGLPATAGRHFALDAATVSVLGFERENRVIRQWNEACHLRSLEPDAESEPEAAAENRDGKEASSR